VAQIAPLVAFGLGSRILAAGPADVHSTPTPGRSCKRKPPRSSRAIRFRALSSSRPLGPGENRHATFAECQTSPASERRTRRTRQPAQATTDGPQRACTARNVGLSSQGSRCTCCHGKQDCSLGDGLIGERPAQREAQRHAPTRRVASIRDAYVVGHLSHEAEPHAQSWSVGPRHHSPALITDQHP
jgi:hypothetical protein